MHGRDTSSRLRHAVVCRREARRLGRFDVIESPDWMAEGLLVGRGTAVVAHLHTPLAVTSRFSGLAQSRDRRIAAALERRLVERGGPKAGETASPTTRGFGSGSSGWRAPCRLLGELSREDVRALVVGARVFVSPSRYENFP